VLFLPVPYETQSPWTATFALYRTHGDRVGRIAPTLSCRRPPIPEKSSIYVNSPKSGADDRPCRVPRPGVGPRLLGESSARSFVGSASQEALLGLARERCSRLSQRLSASDIRLYDQIEAGFCRPDKKLRRRPART